MQLLPGKFVWFEHQSTNLPAARRFYEDLFGWHTETMNVDVTSANANKQETLNPFITILHRNVTIPEVPESRNITHTHLVNRPSRHPPPGRHAKRREPRTSLAGAPRFGPLAPRLIRHPRAGSGKTTLARVAARLRTAQPLQVRQRALRR